MRIALVTLAIGNEYLDIYGMFGRMDYMVTGLL